VVNQSVTPFTFTPIPNSPKGIDEINAIGFRSTNRLLYGIQGDFDVNTNSGWSNEGILTIDSNGAVSSPVIPTGADSWPTIGFNCGDVTPDGSTMYVQQNGGATNNGDRLHIIDLATMSFTFKEYDGPPAGTGGPNVVLDWAVHPTNGLLYGAPRNGKIAILNPFGINALRTEHAITNPLPNISGIGTDGYGAAWFNAAGELFVFQNSGTIYKINLGPDPTNPSDWARVSSQSGPASVRNDGAACLAPGAAKIQLDKTVDPALVPADTGKEVTYTYTITNLSGEQITLTDLEDDPLGDLDGLGTCSLEGPVTLEPAGDAGDSYNCEVSTTITEPTTNTATACGEDAIGNKSCDDDSARVDVYGIEILKKPESQVVESGGAVTFTIIVKNTGNVDLTGVTVDDDIGTVCDKDIGNLSAGATFIYDCTVDPVNAGFTNMAIVTGTPPEGPDAFDDDEARVALFTEQPFEGCTLGFWGSNTEFWFQLTGYSTSDDFDTIFGTGWFTPDITLGEAIKAKGKRSKLARRGTGALLNAATENIYYRYTVDEVIDFVQSGDIDPLVEENERSGTCPVL
jgi:uncharacterized repeat protein (TIGR01451 family)